MSPPSAIFPPPLLWFKFSWRLTSRGVVPSQRARAWLLGPGSWESRSAGASSMPVPLPPLDVLTLGLVPARQARNACSSSSSSAESDRALALYADAEAVRLKTPPPTTRNASVAFGQDDPRTLALYEDAEALRLKTPPVSARGAAAQGEESIFDLYSDAEALRLKTPRASSRDPVAAQREPEAFYLKNGLHPVGASKVLGNFKGPPAAESLLFAGLCVDDSPSPARTKPKVKVSKLPTGYSARTPTTACPSEDCLEEQRCDRRASRQASLTPHALRPPAAALRA
ncbi:unnamed protein product [Prorocentrum cordatum]|uniref:Uncharacterized protein n=1 Tax=Prorocentrum cordatum TaxID=2364126 RepID=A0ABN9PXQ3_9DINO|nr:unnamed protein product [Polarella glacialis]